MFTKALLCLLLQRYTFWSNSQQRKWRISIISIVLATAKIHILKQFTTVGWCATRCDVLCLLLQRYTFWSNSQPQQSSGVSWRDCACYCKDTHFEAIHNVNECVVYNKVIVLATAKIHILKQFTTKWSAISTMTKLCLLLQRYTFWSNSQLTSAAALLAWYCACYCKDTHFEAIHNKKVARISVDVIVLATAKIHILKQFTTKPFRQRVHLVLCLLLQRYTFWSNSQQKTVVTDLGRYCACYCKDTHFEAIHNEQGVAQAGGAIVLATAKIHILKQFTTHHPYQKQLPLLCLLLQRYTFWSNSQPTRTLLYFFIYCACYCKDTHFEAIHNIHWKASAISSIVLATAKIHILKQFTTTTEL